MNKISQHKLLFGIGLVVSLILIGVVSLKLWQSTRFTFRHSAGADTIYGGTVIKKSDGSVARQISKDKPVTAQLSAQEATGNQKVCANLYFADNSEVKINLRTGNSEASNSVIRDKQGWFDLCVARPSSTGNTAEDTGAVTITATRGSANLYSLYGKR